MIFDSLEGTYDQNPFLCASEPNPSIVSTRSFLFVPGSVRLKHDNNMLLFTSIFCTSLFSK